MVNAAQAEEKEQEAAASVACMALECSPLMHVKGEAPSPREGHTMLALDSHRILIFGGGCNSLAFGPQQFNDLFLLDLRESRSIPLQAKGQVPIPRTGHCGASLGDGRCIFFGGSSMAEGYSNEVHVLDTRDWSWSRPQVSGAPPCPRDKQAACLLGTCLYVFGGFGPAQEASSSSEEEEEEEGEEEDEEEEVEEEEEEQPSMSFTWFNDLYTLDTKTMLWERKETWGEMPSPRAAHAAFIVPCPDDGHGHQMVVFGGRDRSGRQNDLFTLDLHTLKWSRKSSHIANGDGPNSHVYIPAPRSFHVMLPLGGDTHAAVSYGGIGASGEMFRGLEVLNLRDMSWSTFTKLKGLWPPLRGASAMVALASEQGDGEVDRLVSFGGSCLSDSQQSMYFNDAYCINIAPVVNLLKQH